MHRSLLFAIAAPVVVTLSGAAKPAPSIELPFVMTEVFGRRPVVDATINGKPFKLVIHANAGSYLQINHADATAVGARDLVHKGAYGIAAPGKVSDLGRDDGIVDRIAIGDWRAAAVPVAVFEVPSGGSQGMLGLPWLTKTGAVLDFARNRVTLPADGRTAGLTAGLRKRGYSAHAMTRDPSDGRYLVSVTLNGVAAPMVVSTVASVDLDSAFAKRAGVALGPVSGSYGGPTGATGEVRTTATPVTFAIGSWRSAPAPVSVEDTYAYSKAPHPADPTAARGGDLGADFLIRAGAVVDFGNSVLYLKD